MAPKSPARRSTRWALAAVFAVAVLLVALSPSFGRAVPTGDYRPPLPPDALTTGCYPLPAGVALDFSYQVRNDGDVDGRRALVLQYNLIDRDEAVRAVLRSFQRGGFTPSTAPAADGRADARGFALTKGAVRVSGYAVPMVPLHDDQIVRGTITLDLPVVERQSDDPVCSDVESTKRFAEATP